MQLQVVKHTVKINMSQNYTKLLLNNSWRHNNREFPISKALKREFSFLDQTVMSWRNKTRINTIHGLVQKSQSSRLKSSLKFLHVKEDCILSPHFCSSAFSQWSPHPVDGARSKLSCSPLLYSASVLEDIQLLMKISHVRIDSHLTKLH